MKSITFLFITICSSFLATAQEVNRQQTPLLTVKNNEAGIFGQQVIGSNNNGDKMMMMGLQYKKWKNEHLGMRIVAAYGKFDNSDDYYISRNFSTASDTVTQRFTQWNINMAILGVGVEAQRVFYKRVVLFAAMELRGGYGSGKQEDAAITRVANGDYENYQVLGSRDANMVYLAATPTIGAKLQFNRFNFGMECSGISTYSTGLKAEGKSRATTGNMDMGSVIHRFFIGYKF